jgi:hypothetical protein
MLGNQSQMLKGDRFIWFYWSQGLWEMGRNRKELRFSGGIEFSFFINQKIIQERSPTVSKIQRMDY